MANTSWSIDPTHSEIAFRVKHLMISSVAGKFTVFNANVETQDEDFATARVSFSADIDSVSTNNEQRDAHLKNNDFFDAANFPRLTFDSTEIVKVDEENYRMHGLLSIRGVQKPVVLSVEMGGIVVDPWGNKRAGFSVKGKINRSDFGMVLSMVSETGNILLGEEIKISAEVQFIKEAQAEPVLA